VVEGDEHGDLAVERDSIHAVMVPIGDEEPATVWLYRVLNSGRDVDLERDGRRMKQGELADVRNDGEAVWAVHSIDAIHVAAADVSADQGDQCVGGVANKGHVHRPSETDSGDLPGQTA